jgi:AcrR family transcriptional regulator
LKKNEASTKDLLLKIAVELFAQQGYAGTSIRQLARKAGIKESSVYHHYESKDAILQAILDYQIAGFYDAGKAIERGRPALDAIQDPVEVWMAGVSTFLQALPPLSQQIGRIIFHEMYFHQGCRQFYLEVLSKARLQMTQDILQSMHKRGLIHCTDTEKTAFCYVSLLQGMDISHSLRAMEGADPRELQAEFLDRIRTFIENLKGNTHE